MQSLNAVNIMDAVIMYGVVRAAWWVINLTYRNSKKNYEQDRTRREIIRKHYIEQHGVNLKECQYNLCASLD